MAQIKIVIGKIKVEERFGMDEKHIDITNATIDGMELVCEYSLEEMVGILKNMPSPIRKRVYTSTNAANEEESATDNDDDSDEEADKEKKITVW